MSLPFSCAWIVEIQTVKEPENSQIVEYGASATQRLPVWMGFLDPYLCLRSYLASSLDLKA